MGDTTARAETAAGWTHSLRCRFWRNVNRGSGCWLWTGGTFPGGYGQFRIGRKKIRAHRAAFVLRRGPIDRGMLVCHRCDVPGCVNPGHLFLGTPRDNAADRNAKGRHAKGPTPRLPGSRNPSAKLAPRQVAAIRRARGTLRQIGARFGISPSQIGNIRRGSSWKE